jgi:type I restriction enzyme R subunit
MKNRRDRPSAFLKIDLPDFIAAHGHISVGEGGHQILIEEDKRRVDARVLEVIEKHPSLAALREGRELTEINLSTWNARSTSNLAAMTVGLLADAELAEDEI